MQVGTADKPVGSERTGPKFSLDERSRLKARVIQLAIRDYTQTEIAEIVGVSQAQVSIWLKEMRDDWKSTIQEGREELVAQKRAQYQELRREAWQEMERAKEGFERMITACGTKGDSSWTKEEIIKETRRATKQFMDVIAETYRAERTMLGLDVEPKNSGVNVNIGLNWNNILIEAQQEPDPIQALETRINALEPEEVAALPPITPAEVLLEEQMG